MTGLPVTPIALAGVAIALVFTALAKNKKMPRWWPAAAYFLAFIALVGALGLTYMEISPPSPPVVTATPAPVIAVPALENPALPNQTATVGDLADHADAKVKQQMNDTVAGQQKVDVGKVGAGATVDLQQKQ